MENTTSIPPISSPHGVATPSPHLNEKSIRVPVRFQLGADFRHVKFQLLVPVSPLIFLLSPLLMALLTISYSRQRFWFVYVIVASVTFLLVMAPLILLAMFVVQICSSRRFEVWVSQSGLTRRYPQRDLFFPWSKIAWMRESNGDIFLSSFADGCFIPRETFKSREEALEFLSIARELKSGAAWREQWSGRVFGVHSDDNNPQ